MLREDVAWEPAFDTSDTGTLSAVWGSGPEDVFIVGGDEERGEIYHYDGAEWAPMDVPDGVAFLVWVYGFGPDDVYAVGEEGSVVHFDGSSWSALDSGLNIDFWGVYGDAPDDLWMVGEGEGETPAIAHYDGAEFSEAELEENPRAARALLKVWGIEDRNVILGENGTIAELEDGAWEPVSTGEDATEMFVSLWGTGPDRIVAAGGESRAQIAVRDAEGWETEAFPTEPGLNGVYMDHPEIAVVSGFDGFLGRYDVETGELIREEAAALRRLHSVWGDGEGRYYSVGGTFAEPHEGEAFVRDPN